MFKAKLSTEYRPPTTATLNSHIRQVYDECPTAGSTDCLDNATAAIGCSVASVAGRVGSSYAVRLEGPEFVSGTIDHSGDGIFAAEYVGPVAGVYDLQVKLAIMMKIPGKMRNIPKFEFSFIN